MLAVRSCGEFHGKLMRDDFNNRESRGWTPWQRWKPPLTHRWTIATARGERHSFEIRVVEIEKNNNKRRKMVNVFLKVF